jgi:alkylation response protein AidB-like acyl-CoA dehydrogenase
MFCSPYFSSVALAVNAVLNAGSPADCQRWLPELASGQTIGTLALLDAGDDWDAAGVTMEAQQDGARWQLSGSKRLVTAGAAADLVIVAARLPGSQGAEGIGLFVVRSDAPGCHATGLEAIDATRPLANLAFDGVAAEPLGTPGSAGAALERTLDQARVCLAIEAAGGAARCLESAVEYVKQRIQFGRPIGSFQAVKHTCAVDLLEVESAKSVAYWACWVAENSPDELAEAASVAKSVCDDAYARTSDDNIHLHGGVGVTWEATPHLFFKRAKADQILLGDPHWQRARIAAQQGL